jgi:hypothetical protein
MPVFTNPLAWTSFAPLFSMSFLVSSLAIFISNDALVDRSSILVNDFTATIVFFTLTQIYHTPTDSYRYFCQVALTPPYIFHLTFPC